MGFISKDNMAYNFSIHTDTDNLHIHFSFIEKKPNYIIGNKTCYRRKGKLSLEEIDFLKNEVAITIERKKYLKPMIKETNMEIENLKKYFNKDEKNFILYDKKDLILEDMILRLGKSLNERLSEENIKVKYCSLKNEEDKYLIKKIKKHLFNSKSEFYADYQELKNH